MKRVTPVGLFLLLAGLVALLVQPWLRTGPEALISWDELGYYLYLPATFIYGDLRHLGFVPALLSTYQPTGYFYQALALDGGNWVMAYSLGLSLLQAPFFFLGHAGAHLFGYPPDGLSAPYQCAIWCSGVFYTALGVRALSRFLTEYFAPRVVLLVVGLLLLGTNLLTYALLNNALTHCYLFALYAGLLRGTQQWHARGKFRDLLGLVGCLGLLLVIRPSEVIAVLLPALWGLHAPTARAAKWQLVRAQWLRIGGVGAAALLPWGLQMAYWHWTTGHWLFNYYQHMGLGFDWATPHLYEILFSARKGWLLYTPLAVLLLASLGFLLRPAGRPWRWPVLGFVLLNLYVVSSWRVWWYGGSLGQRALVQSYAVLALPLALMVEWLWARRRLRLVVAGLAVVGVLVNLSFAWQYQVGNMLTDGIEPRQYREYLVNPQGDYIPAARRAARYRWRDDALAARTRLDTLPAPADPADPAAVLRLGAGGAEYAGNLTLAAQPLLAARISWLRLRFDAFVPRTDPLTLNGLRVVIETRTERSHLRKWAAASAYALFGQGGVGKWRPFVQDVALPATLKPTDVVKLYLWCPGPDSTLVRNFTVEGLRLR